MNRIDKFEKMLSDIQAKYENVLEKMKKMKAEGKNKTVTYRQLMAEKMTLKNILITYKTYGIIDEISEQAEN